MRFAAPLDPGEQVITCNRPHPARLIGPALVLLLGIFCSSAAQVLAQGYSGWSLVAPVLLIASLLYGVSRTVRWLLTGYALTTSRLVVFHGLRRSRPLSIPLEQVVGARGPGRRPFSQAWGTAEIRTAGRVLELTYQHKPGRFVDLCGRARAERLRALGWPGPGV